MTRFGFFSSSFGRTVHPKVPRTYGAITSTALYFIWFVIGNKYSLQDKKLNKTKENLLVFLDEIITLLGKRVQDYALDIKVRTEDQKSKIQWPLNSENVCERLSARAIKYCKTSNIWPNLQDNQTEIPRPWCGETWCAGTRRSVRTPNFTKSNLTSSFWSYLREFISNNKASQTGFFPSSLNALKLSNTIQFKWRLAFFSYLVTCVNPIQRLCPPKHRSCCRYSSTAFTSNSSPTNPTWRSSLEVFKAAPLSWSTLAEISSQVHSLPPMINSTRLSLTSLFSLSPPPFKLPKIFRVFIDT